MLAARREKQGKKAPVRANRELSLLSTVFAYGLEQGWCTVEPCLGVRRNKERPRTHGRDRSAGNRAAGGVHVPDLQSAKTTRHRLGFQVDVEPTTGGVAQGGGARFHYHDHQLLTMRKF